MAWRFAPKFGLDKYWVAAILIWANAAVSHAQEKYDPYKTVCIEGPAAWSRQVCENVKQGLARSLRIQANASPALLEFEEIMMPLFSAARFAYLAGSCRQRSDSYVRVFTIAFLTKEQREAARLKLSPAEVMAAGYEFERRMAQDKIDNGGGNDWQEACRRLFNSPTMDRLDALHRELNGNYH